MTTGTLITVAPTGAESSKAAVPALPVTLDELVSTAKECEALGASIIHVHIRDDAAEPTLDQGRLRATVARSRPGSSVGSAASSRMCTWMIEAPSASHSLAVDTSSSRVTGSGGTAALLLSAPVGATVITVPVICALLACLLARRAL